MRDLKYVWLIVALNSIEFCCKIVIKNRSKLLLGLELQPQPQTLHWVLIYLALVTLSSGPKLLKPRGQFRASKKIDKLGVDDVNDDIDVDKDQK